MEQHPILLAGLTGYVIAAMFSSIPVGPINLTILNEGACRGFRWALMIGLGAATMEVIYCAVSFTGFSALFEDPMVKAIMQLFTFLFLLFIGMKFLTAQTVHVPTKLDSASRKIEAELGKKLHPHSAFTTGFVRVMANLGVLLTWIVLTGNFVAHDWVADTFAAKVACVAGVALGTTTWFFIFSYGISRGHGKFQESTLLRLQHISGICLISVGLFDGAHIVLRLAHQAHHRL
ncbi:MAG TPA: LysE family transporter [Verrucomicrobiae bacterium]|nr:LysE family transporter [Verrucomicrobiae bacterium]